MAGTAVLAFDIRIHGVADRASVASREYFGVAEFTAVPDGMLLVREANGVDPRVTCCDRKIFSVLHLRRFDG
jgi:hypothetical protein